MRVCVCVCLYERACNGELLVVILLVRWSQVFAMQTNKNGIGERYVETLEVQVKHFTCFFNYIENTCMGQSPYISMRMLCTFIHNECIMVLDDALHGKGEL